MQSLGVLTEVIQQGPNDPERGFKADGSNLF